jgi:hypothetical protein
LIVWLSLDWLQPAEHRLGLGIGELVCRRAGNPVLSARLLDPFAQSYL